MNKRTPKIVNIAIMTTITIVLWIFFDVYRSLTTQTSIEVPEELLTPIDPALDSSVFETMTERTYYSQGQTQPFTPQEDTQVEEEESEIQEEIEAQAVTVSPTPTNIQSETP